MVETIKQYDWGQKRNSLLSTLATPGNTVSLARTNLARLVGLGYPTLCREILGPGKFIPRLDPTNPNRYLLSGEEYSELVNIVDKIRTPR